MSTERSCRDIYYPESRFGGFTDVDGTISFYLRVNALLDPESVVLDVGCGRGAWGEDPVAIRRWLRKFKGRCRRVIGIDVDEGAAGNPFLDEFLRIEGERWPLTDGSVDLCICDNVLEHIATPKRFMQEIRRVLRTGGHLCIRTPNAMGYVALMSRMIPTRFHSGILAHAQPERKEEDVFPTFYRCNTASKLSRLLEENGFESCVYGYEAEPAYFAFSRFLYLLGVIHQRIAPKMFRQILHAFATKR